MLAHFTDILTNLITNLYVTTGLFGIILAMAIESCCIPLPSEVVMPIAGIMIAQGKLLQGTNHWVAFVLVALAGAVGCLLGSIVAYGIGYSGGRSLLLKYGRYALISQHDSDKADKFFERYGSATAFFSRLLPVVRTYISLPAGIAKMPFVKFCVYSFLGSFPWCFLLAYLGYILGNHLDTLSPIFHSLDVVILVALVALIVLYVWRHIRNDRKARAELAEREARKAREVRAANSVQWQQAQETPTAQQWHPQHQQPVQFQQSAGQAQPVPQFQKPWIQDLPPQHYQPEHGVGVQQQPFPPQNQHDWLPPSDHTIRR